MFFEYEGETVMGKISSVWYDVRSYWERPRKSEYVSYKEVFNFCVGGMGIKTLGSLLSYMTLASTCLLFGSVYGLSPRHFIILTIITNVISILKTPFISMLVDNTHTKIGKFRPYVLWAGIPTAVGIVGMAFIPLDAPPVVKVVVVGILINLVTIAQPLYNNAYMGVSQIITPNSYERTKILSISEFIANLGPSLVQLLLPSLAGLFLGKDCMTNILTYRIFFPIFAVAGFLMGLLVMTSTRERTLVQDKQKEEKLPFFKGLKEISKSRYFWIVSISKFFDGFKGGIGVLLAWVCTYQLNNSSALGIVQTVTSMAFTPGIILAPLLMKKMGARNAAFFAHALNCAAALLMLFTFRKGFVFFVIALFCYNFASGPQYIMQTSILSDGLDYHQDKYGTRLEGFAQNFMLMITTVGTILSTVTFSLIYETFGLVADETTGLTDYSVLTDAAVREPIIQWVVIVAMIAGGLSALPYLLCNLKAKDMIEIRERLEYKKFCGREECKGLDEEELKKLYAEYLENCEREHEAERLKVQVQKKEAEDRRLARLKEEEDFENALRGRYAELIESGETKKKAEAEIKTMKKERKEKQKQISAEKRKAFIEEYKAFRKRKKAFIENDVRERKARGEKGFLKILAKEKFEDVLIEENIQKAEEEALKTGASV